MTVTKVISGGQCGADIAGLRAAKRLGLQTGGWMPKGFRTLNGLRPEYAEQYGLVETESEQYPPRTKRNVQQSDGTIRFAENFNTAGERCTLKYIREFNKPNMDVWINNEIVRQWQVIKWLHDNDIHILNVAGNARFEIEGFVENYLLEVLRVPGL